MTSGTSQLPRRWAMSWAHRVELVCFQESLLGVLKGFIISLPQTHLIKLGTKMLTLLPGERKPNAAFTQRRGTRQTSIASFVTLEPGMVPTGNASVSEEQNKCVHVSVMESLRAGHIALEKLDIIHTFIHIFAGSVLLHLI